MYNFVHENFLHLCSYKPGIIISVKFFLICNPQDSPNIFRSLQKIQNFLLRRDVCIIYLPSIKKLWSSKFFSLKIWALSSSKFCEKKLDIIYQYLVGNILLPQISAYLQDVWLATERVFHCNGSSSLQMSHHRVLQHLWCLKQLQDLWQHTGTCHEGPSPGPSTLPALW